MSERPTLTSPKIQGNTVRLGSRCRSVFKTREFRFDYLTNMIDGIEKMSFVTSSLRYHGEEKHKGTK